MRDPKVNRADVTITMIPDDDNSVSSMHNTFYYPTTIWGGSEASEETERTINIAPEIEAAGIAARMGGFTSRRLRKDEVTIDADTFWTLTGEMKPRDNNDKLHRLAKWQLKREGNDARVPLKIRMGFLTKFPMLPDELPDELPFKLTVGIEGALRERFLGEHTFDGTSGTFSIRRPNKGGHLSVKDCKPETMRDDMKDKGFEAVLGVEFQNDTPVL